MDVVIYTADPDEVSVTAIWDAIADLGYYVASVTIEERS
jgi:hypothetical protein